MNAVFLYLVLSVGVVGVAVGGVFLVIVRRERESATRGMVVLGVGLGLFFAVIGALLVTAFAAPSVRAWALWIVGFLLIARSVAFFVMRRVMKRRDRTS